MIRLINAASLKMNFFFFFWWFKSLVGSSALANHHPSPTCRNLEAQLADNTNYVYLLVYIVYTFGLSWKIDLTKVGKSWLMVRNLDNIYEVINLNLIATHINRMTWLLEYFSNTPPSPSIVTSKWLQQSPLATSKQHPQADTIKEIKSGRFYPYKNRKYIRLLNLGVRISLV